MTDEPTSSEPGPHGPVPEPGSFEPPPTGADPGPGFNPPPPPAPAPRRLVRDPYSPLGGVASGLAHYYGLDVSLVRVVVLLLGLTTGVGVLAYILAWLIIPRADYWPPAGPPRGARSLSNRDVGIGLAAAGLLLALAIGGGTAGFLVPLVLVGGGVWLLLQPESTTVAMAANAGPGGSVDGGAISTAPPPPSVAVPAQAYTYGTPAPVGAPVPPRSRKRRWAVVALVALLVLSVLAIPLLVIGGLFFVVAESEISEADFVQETSYVVPISAEEFPLVIDSDGGEFIIDLTSLEPADFAGADEPAELNVEVGFGRIEVIVPPDLGVSVDASATVGNVEVFGQVDDGITPDVTAGAVGPDLHLELDAGVGEVVVRRG